MDLTRLAPESAERWIAAQANIWHVPVTGLPLDQAQARLNEEIVRRRTESQRKVAIETAWRSAPFLLAGAIFLLLELLGWRRVRARIYLFQMALLAAALALAFWLFPSGLTWIHNEAHRPWAFIGFYVAAALAGFAVFQFRRVVNLLWFVAVAVWLFAYFGPRLFADQTRIACRPHFFSDRGCDQGRGMARAFRQTGVVPLRFAAPRALRR